MPSLNRRRFLGATAATAATLTALSAAGAGDPAAENEQIETLVLEDVHGPLHERVLL